MADMSDMTDAAVDGAFGFVLAVRDATHGLSFWNRQYGFGPLFNATVFTDAQATAIDVPLSDEEPTWMALPALPAVDRS